jgi:hydroxymethylbilane synthase
MTRTLRIGTRGSDLALVQARWVAARLAEHGVATEIEIIRTEGDDRPVDTAWGEGAFVARIVAALVDGRVDLAVHSAKDVPTTEPDKLVIAAYPPREDPRDALVCRVRETTVATLPQGARVGTDSPRRVAFLHALRPDLQLHPLHGNVDTRLAKLDRGDSDALVLAVAGLTRLGRADRIDEVLPSALIPSAPGQGSLALQVRADDTDAIAAVGLLDDKATRAAVEAERALLNGTGGGCRSPIGAIGTVNGDEVTLLAGAARLWSPGPGVRVDVPEVGWVRGRAPVGERLALAERMAARIVALRTSPRVLVARPAGRAEDLLDGLGAHGIEAVHVPAIEIGEAAPGGPLDEALAAVRPSDCIVLTSANAARALLGAAGRVGFDLTSVRWAAVGEATARVLHEASIGDAFVPSEPNGVALARELPLDAARVLVPQADIADRQVVDILRERGFDVSDVIAYETCEAPAPSVPLLAAALDDGPIDALILTSGSSARGLLALAGDAARAQLTKTPVIAAGASTASAARDAGYATVLTAPSPAAADLAAFAASVLGVEGADLTRQPADDLDPTGAVR